jgi:hypothetical protein
MGSVIRQVEETIIDLVVVTERLTEEVDGEQNTDVAKRLVSAKIIVGKKKYIDITDLLSIEDIETIVDYV